MVETIVSKILCMEENFKLTNIVTPENMQFYNIKLYKQFYTI